MAFWVRGARRLRGISLRAERNAVPQGASQVSSSEPLLSSQQDVGRVSGCRIHQQQADFGFSRLSSELHTRRIEDLGSSTGVTELSRCSTLMVPQDFHQAGSLYKTALVLGLSSLSLWLITDYCYAEEQTMRITDLQPQPEAKSNIHTAKWRIFTDKARDLCSQGSFDKAETYFYKALEEAKLGFGEGDPHVASCYNNLAELFRMKKEYDKAEPFYLEAVNRLKKSSGYEDGSVGFALHNLAGFYLLQRKLNKADECYREALKIKGRALGLDHPEYANTMFHLGEVVRLQGNVGDSIALIKDSIRILEQVGLGDTSIAIKRLSRLAEIHFFSGQLGEAETVQRKIIHVLDFSKDSSSKDMVSALESLSTTLQRQGKVDECKELLQKSICLAKQSYGEKDMHVAGLLLKLGGIINQQGKDAASRKDATLVQESYDKAEDLLSEAVDIAERQWKEAEVRKWKGSGKTNFQNSLFLIQCLAQLGQLRVQKLDLMADDESWRRMYRDAEENLCHAIDLSESILARQGGEVPSDFSKLLSQCSQQLINLRKRVNKQKS